jgi:hypothetical protein
MVRHFLGLSLSHLSAAHRTARCEKTEQRVCARAKRHKKIITTAIIQYVKTYKGWALLKFSSHTFPEFICEALFCCSCKPRVAYCFKWSVELSKWSISSCSRNCISEAVLCTRESSVWSSGSREERALTNSLFFLCLLCAGSLSPWLLHPHFSS